MGLMTMFERTKNLRFVESVIDTNVCRVLQQQWIDDDPRDEGPIRYEWRDVPTVNAEER